MNLLEVRTNLVELSGRFDLVVDTNTYDDRGANFFIQAGQRLLDGMIEAPNHMYEFPVSLTAGDPTIEFSEVRAVKRVRIIDDGKTSYLDKAMLDNILESNPHLGDAGLPNKYAIGIKRDESGDSSGKKLFVSPKPNKDYDLIVECLYLSTKLTEDDDVSWWSDNYPDLLIQAALYKAEVFLRNTQGSNDWLSQISFAVGLIDNDKVEEVAAEIDQMKNSWDYKYSLPKRSRDHEQRKV
jgi:hypothetical protein